MPELTVTHIVLLAVLAIVGAVAGWVARDRRAADEQETLRTMWQEEIDRQRNEQKRLADQNKGLMEQINSQQVRQSKLQKSAAELSTAMREVSNSREELQRDIESRDARIENLARDLRNWQDRLPPLIDRYRKRDEEAGQLEAQLEKTLSAVRILEEQRGEAAARPASIQPLSNAGQFTDGLEASNDEDDEYVDEVDGEDTPVFLDESTMIESEAMPDDQPALAAEFDDDPQAQATATDDDREVQAAATDDDREVQSTENDDAGDPAPDDADDAHETDDTHETEGADDTHDTDDADEADDADDTDDADEADDADDVARQRDNLRKIRGVGPAIEKTLNEMGIFSYRQIADMTDYDIDRVTRRLKGFHGRIQREDWIGQAQSLLDKAALA